MTQPTSTLSDHAGSSPSRADPSASRPRSSPLFAIASTALAWSGYQSQVGRVVDEAALRARGAAADVDRYVQAKWRTLNAIAAMPAFVTGDAAQIRVVIDDLATRDLGFDAGFSWIDTPRVHAGAERRLHRPADRLHRPRPRPDGAPDRRPTVSPAVIGAVNQAPIVGFVVPTSTRPGTMNGLVGSGIRLGDLSMGADTLRYAGGTDVVVVDNLGQLIAGPSPVNALEHVADGFPLAALQADPDGGAVRDITGPYGRPGQLVGYALAPSAGWLVLVQRSADEAFLPASSAFALQVVLILGGSLLAVVVLLWASWRLDAAVAEQTRAYAQELATRAQLEAAIATLEERQVLRDAFVGVMSHELRTPVTTIYGAAKLLAKSPRRPELETLVEDIEEEADRLHRITEDLLVLSRAEHGLVELRPEPVLVQRLVPAVIAEVRRRHPSLDVTRRHRAGAAADRGRRGRDAPGPRQPPGQRREVRRRLADPSSPRARTRPTAPSCSASRTRARACPPRTSSRSSTCSSGPSQRPPGVGHRDRAVRRPPARRRHGRHGHRVRGRAARARVPRDAPGGGRRRHGRVPTR